LAAQTLDDAEETYPLYANHADVLGAQYGDQAIVTASYAGSTLTRTVRLIPNADGEQQLNFVFPSRGQWQPFADTLANAIAASATTLWAGGPNGLVSWNLSTGMSTTHQLGLPSTDVRAIAVVSDSQVWVGTANGLAKWDGVGWTTQNTGLAANAIRALAVGPNGWVYAGAYDALNGGVSVYNGNTWQPLPDVNGALPNLVTALAVDSAGHLWVGTDGYGATRWNGSSGQTFATQNGLSSDVVSGLAIESDAVWFSTRAYINANGVWGGVSRYSLISQTWTTYTQTTQTHGLNVNDVLGVVVDKDGLKWFNTLGGGISSFDGLNWWHDSTNTGLASNVVHSLRAHADGTLWAASSGGVNRFTRGVPGSAPVISQVAITPVISRLGEPITFRADATDTDTQGGMGILAYEWHSSLDGALGSEGTFALRRGQLRPGLHTISVRALDDEGVWSATLTTTLTIENPRLVFLPFIRR
jgi:ligand-binding sensor domain-containing protein